MGLFKFIFGEGFLQLKIEFVIIDVSDTIYNMASGDMNNVRIRFVNNLNEITFNVPRGAIVEYCDPKYISKNNITIRTEIEYRSADVIKTLLTANYDYFEYELNDNEIKQVRCICNILGMDFNSGVLPPGIKVL